MAEITVEIPGYMQTEMDSINKHLSQYPGHKAIASSLGQFIPQEIVAGLIGCIIPESGTDHTILNATEYRGGGADGTYGWNCGEGLIQWTYWKYKLPLIKTYNEDSRSTQKLPTTWEIYSQGQVIQKGKTLHAPSDGKHIAGLSLDNQMLFLTLYYGSLINKLKGETNLAVIVAKIYQQKAGVGLYQNISYPVVRAYTTSMNKYPSSTGNHYLQSLKIAAEYLDAPVIPSSVPYPEEYISTNYSYVSAGTQNNSPIYSGISSMQRSKIQKNTKGLILGYHMRQK